MGWMADRDWVLSDVRAVVLQGLAPGIQVSTVPGLPPTHRLPRQLIERVVRRSCAAAGAGAGAGAGVGTAAGAGVGTAAGAGGIGQGASANSRTAAIAAAGQHYYEQLPLCLPRHPGTRNTLHSNVLRSFSLSVNVAGRKLWRLLPPQYSYLLLDRYGHTAAWHFFAEDLGRLCPRLDEAWQHILPVVQQAGEAIFVFSDWFHTVENLDDCISINHNWLNGHNVPWTWALLQQERQQAEQGIENCYQLCSPAEFESLVMRNMGANDGLDYAGHLAVLHCIT